MTDPPLSQGSSVQPSWTQPLCEACFAAWTLGRGEPLCEPTRLREGGDPCCVCGSETAIYVRIDPKLTAPLKYARPDDDVPVRCRTCGATATVAIRSGLEWHPTCDDCAGWWGERRHGPLSEVEPGYVYEPLPLSRDEDTLRDAASALLAVYESGEDITGEIPEVVALRLLLSRDSGSDEPRSS